MTLRLMLCAFILLALGGCQNRAGFRQRRPIPWRWTDGPYDAPDRPRLRDRQGPT